MNPSVDTRHSRPTPSRTPRDSRATRRPSRFPEPGTTTPRRPLPFITTPPSAAQQADAILEGDCLDRLKTLADESVDLIATDPPYGYGFMGKDWDKAVPSVDVWKECLRVLKPGGFAFVMSAPRQDVLGRMIVNLQDAGFVMGFTPIYWSYASGFPKAANIVKAADRRAKATGDTPPDHLDGAYAGYQPKPAVEVVLVVMKPLSEKTYLDQALSNGKGITWLDDCRIPVGGSDLGRFPANLIVSDDSLDDGTMTVSRPTKGGGRLNGGGVAGGGLHAGGIKERMGSSFADSGCYSRYFDLDDWWTRRASGLPAGVQATLPFIHVSKPSKKEKNAGLDGRKKTIVSDGRKTTNDTAFQRGATERSNPHPTIKPLALMSYLITLGSREGDLVVDPYAGSGTTCVAAKALGRHYVGIERETDYVSIARARVGAVPDVDPPALGGGRPADPRRFRTDRKARTTSSCRLVAARTGARDSGRPDDPRRTTPTRPAPKPTFIDLFAGIGGFHIALNRLGAECVFASEWDRYARQTYELNMKKLDPEMFEKGNFAGDITLVDPRGIPDFDVLTGGFPCQSFSAIGKRRGFQDTRGTLFFNILRILDEKKPEAFFLENVRGLLTHDDGRTFEVIRASLDDVGYSLFHKVVRASDHGLPTHRPRLYMVGFKDRSIDFKFPDPTPLKFTVSDVLGGDCPRDVGYTLRVGGRGSGLNRRHNWDTYLVDGHEHRLTVEEGKRMMGFPFDFSFPVSTTQAMKQLGNSVAVDAVQAVGAEIKKRSWDRSGSGIRRTNAFRMLPRRCSAMRRPPLGQKPLPNHALAPRVRTRPLAGEARRGGDA